MLRRPTIRTISIERDGRHHVRLSEKYITDNALRGFEGHYHDALLSPRVWRQHFARLENEDLRKTGREKKYPDVSDVILRYCTSMLECENDLWDRPSARMAVPHPREKTKNETIFIRLDSRSIS